MNLFTLNAAEESRRADISSKAVWEQVVNELFPLWPKLEAVATVPHSVDAPAVQPSAYAWFFMMKARLQQKLQKWKVQLAATAYDVVSVWVKTERGGSNRMIQGR